MCEIPLSTKMPEREILNLIVTVKRIFSDEDVRFMQKVKDDITYYMKGTSMNTGLVFPPLDVTWRYMIHTFCEQKGLFGLTIGEGIRRMILVIDVDRLELSTHRVRTVVALLEEAVLKRDGTTNTMENSNSNKVNSFFNVDAPEFHPKKKDPA